MASITRARLEERAFLATQVQQAHVDNARALWLRYVNRNRAEVQEKAEQLKALSSLAALLAGFALVSFLEFQFAVDADYNRALLPLFATTTSITVGVEVAAVVLCSLMLASIMRVGKMYVSEQEEAEFMHRCHIFISRYRPGSRPPEPSRTFTAYWAHRCESEWSTAFRLFSIGVPCFFINLALAGWIKFHQASTPTAASLVTCCMGIALLWNLYTHRKWGAYLLQDEEQAAGDRVTLPHVGLPFDWHLTQAGRGNDAVPPGLAPETPFRPGPEGFSQAAPVAERGIVFQDDGSVRFGNTDTRLAQDGSTDGGGSSHPNGPHVAVQGLPLDVSERHGRGLAQRQRIESAGGGAACVLN